MKKLILCAAVLTLAITGFAQKQGKKQIALQLYSLRDDFKKNGFDATIKVVAEAGYTAIEAADYNNETGKFYGKTPAEFKTAVENLGMKVLSSHTSRGLNAEELKNKDLSAALKWWEKTIADHATAGMKYIVTPWMEVPKTLADLQTYCEYYNAIGAKCREKGLSFGYHNHDHEFTEIEGKVMYNYMLENTKPELVFFQMDVYWVVIGKRSPVEYFQKYQKRFKLLHIKDLKELGQSGMLGFDAIFNHADVAGLQYPIVEVEQYNYSPAESVKRSLQYLLDSPFVKKHY